MEGQTVSHYRIIEKLGEGGMGTVYRAEDTVLGRPVALKFLSRQERLPEPEITRFLQEARAAASIDHPNVCTIYEADRDAEGRIFIAMAYYAGEPLSRVIAAGPLDEVRALDIVIDAAAGLQAAHERGIVHRDVKSGNIMLTSDRQVKLMDFGLAGGEAFAHLTRTGTPLGTYPYMSPEQARGEKTDRRTDIWSLGVVFYEMIAGRLPFRSEYADGLVYAILHTDPEPLTALRSGVPMELERIIAKALARNREDRYQRVDDLLVDLRSLRKKLGTGEAAAAEPRHVPAIRRSYLVAGGAAALVLLGFAAYFLVRPERSPTGPNSIAVLPFHNVGGRAADDAFCDGMTESIITDIGGLHGVSVIARNSVFSYKGRPDDIREVGRNLGVNYVLEGSIQREGSALRVHAQLVSVASGFQLWAEKFDRNVKDVFAVQDDISSRVVTALRLTLTPDEERALRRRPTDNMDAYDAYTQGKFAFSLSGDRGLKRSIDLLAEATQLDPNFALAYAALGKAYTAAFFNTGPGNDYERKAQGAIDMALRLDSTLAEGYATRGDLLWTRAYGFAHERAVLEIQHALRLNPNLAAAHRSLGSIYFHIGLLGPAMRELWTALVLDPTSSFEPPRIARIYWYRQNFDSALAQFGKVEEKTWDSEKAIVLHDLGRDAEARELLRSNGWVEGKVDNSDIAGAYALLDAATMRPEEAAREISACIAIGENSSHFHHAEFTIACAYALLGEIDKSVSWLRRASNDGLPCYPLFWNDPNLKSLRGDSAYLSLMRSLREQWEHFTASLDQPVMSSVD